MFCPGAFSLRATALWQDRTWWAYTSAIALSRLVESDEEATIGPGKALLAGFGENAATTSSDGVRRGFTRGVTVGSVKAVAAGVYVSATTGFAGGVTTDLVEGVGAGFSAGATAGFADELGTGCYEGVLPR